jgi:hypothetical protein
MPVPDERKVHTAPDFVSICVQRCSISKGNLDQLWKFLILRAASNRKDADGGPLHINLHKVEAHVNITGID